jgi:hypothetical protein
MTAQCEREGRARQLNPLAAFYEDGTWVGRIPQEGGVEESETTDANCMSWTALLPTGVAPVRESQSHLRSYR